MEEKGIIITPILKSLSNLRGLGYKKIIQNKKFHYGIKIKNIGKSIINEGIIKNINIIPFKTNINFQISTKREEKVKKLESGEIHEIWLGTASSPVSGEFWINFELELEDKRILFRESELCNFNIKDESILQQEITNKLLILLTIITISISFSKLLI